MDCIRVQRPDRNDMLGLGDHKLRSRGRRLIEVVLGHPVDQIARRVGLPGPHERHVSSDRRDKDHLAAIDQTRLLALGKLCSCSGRGEEAADPGPARPDRLGQRALREEVDLAFTRLSRSDDLRIAGEVRSDRFPNLTVSQ